MSLSVADSSRQNAARCSGRGQVTSVFRPWRQSTSLAVDPVPGASIAQVGLNPRGRGHGATADQAAVDQGAEPVADGAHRLARFEHLHEEVDRGGVPLR